jgi:hypothetical protein
MEENGIQDPLSLRIATGESASQRQGAQPRRAARGKQRFRSSDFQDGSPAKNSAAPSITLCRYGFLATRR